MGSIQNLIHLIYHYFVLVLLVLHPAPSTDHGRSVGQENDEMVLAAMRAPDTGYWHTNRSLILDSWNRPVRIEGINWYGFETERGVPGGLTVQDYKTILQTIKADGYNTVRLPFSNQMVETPAIPAVPTAIKFSTKGRQINQDLKGLNSLQIMDKVVDYAGVVGLKVILDNHRSDAGDSAQANGLWYTGSFPESSWIADWQTLAVRYKDTSTVIGMDLRNEPHNADNGGACWDCGGERDWHLAAARAGDSILKVNPKLLIFVEGTDSYRGDSSWWGGNLEGVLASPVKLSVANQLVYSPHLYGPKEYAQPWFNAKTTPESLEAVWTKHWAYITKSGLAPIWLGEFGTTNDVGDLEGSDPGSEGQWFGALVAYLGRNHEVGWAFWALNGEDEDGLLDADYVAPVNGRKQQMMMSIMSPEYAMSPDMTMGGVEEIAGVRDMVPVHRRPLH